MIKTFRGLLADGGQDRIRLGTIKGKVGYQITKFEIIPYNPAGDDSENTIAIWKESAAASAATHNISFTDADLLAAGYIENAGSNEKPMTVTIIFDNEVFNQDIYVTNQVATVASDGINYYIELEVISLTDMGAEYTTLKNIRTATSTI